MDETLLDAASSHSVSIPGADRLLDIPGLRNVRDTGSALDPTLDPAPGSATGPGLASSSPVVPGLLYRSGMLALLTPEGAARLGALGLRTIIDLRSPRELKHLPNALHDLDVTVLHLPTMPVDGRIPLEETQESFYLFMAETAGPPIVAGIQALIRPGALPALLHCAVGKDRTGVTIAVIQAALGLSDEHIVADYLVSNLGLGLHKGPSTYLDEHGVEQVSRPIRAELILSVLTRIRAEHGEIADFLQHHGLALSELLLLRSLLLTGPAEPS